MKYKMLINGQKNAFAKEFFQQSKYCFECLITSTYIDDIIAHFKLFQPDAYICFIDTIDGEIINQIYKLREDGVSKETRIIIILHNDIAVLFEKLHPSIADLTIKRPISPDNMILKIIRFFDSIEELKESGLQSALQEKINETESEIEIENKTEEKKSILIVDDDRNVLKMLKSALGEAYNITTMANGILVEKFFETKTADLIILDYEMPIETGAEIFRKLKKNEKTKNIPVCFLTGVNDAEKIREILLLKPHGYLLKPINMEMLLSTISNLID